MPKTSIPDGFTPKEYKFIHWYVALLNGTQAAIKAGYSKRSAAEISSENLRKPHIKNEVDRLIQEKLMSADEVMLRLNEQGSAEYAQFIQPNGTVDLKSLLDAGKGHLIKGIRPTKEGKEIIFYDGQKALGMIAKRLGLLDDNVNIKIEGELEKLLIILDQELDAITYERILTRLAESST